MKTFSLILGLSFCTYSAAQQPFGYLDAELPPNYAGANCPKLYKAASKLQGKKDKYETTEEYEQRISKLKDFNLLDEFKVGDQIAFKLETKGLGVVLDYNADAQSLVAKQMASIASMPLNNKLANVLTISSKLVSSKSGIGSNSFGVKRRMETYNYTACGIALTNIDYEPDLMLYADGKNIPADKVRSAEKNAAFLIVGSIVAPFHGNAYRSMGATLDSPTEEHWEFDVLPIKVVQTIVYNTKTGEVLLRRDFK